MTARRAALFVARTLLVGVAYGALNLVAARFQVFPGVALVYPASALGVVAAILWRWEGAVGVFLATFLTPWDPSASWTVMLRYSAGNTLEAVLPALVLRPRRAGSDVAVFARIVTWTCVVNTLANAALGRGLPLLMGADPAGVEALPQIATWWLADAMAVAVLGLPVLLALRPDLFFRETRLVSWNFVRTPSFALGIALVLFVGAFLLFWDVRFGGTFNWPHVLFLLPLGLLIYVGGVAGGATGSWLVAFTYLVTLGVESYGIFPGVLGSPQRLIPVYGNLLLFTVFAWTAGTVRSRNSWLHRRLEERWTSLREISDATVRALAAVMEARDPHTERHLERVSRVARRIAERMGLDDLRVDQIHFGALLHDVGKVGVPAEVLLKPGPLDESEEEAMERHIDHGAEILERAGLPEDIVELVRYHEERWDGLTDGRFPGRFGLRGERIPLGARIIAVADAFDAMTSQRPYRDPMAPAEALAELRAEAGRQFDPRVVEVFLEIVEEGRTDRSIARDGAGS